MPRIEQFKVDLAALGRLFAIRAMHARPRTSIIPSKTGFGELKLNFCKHVDRLLQRLSMFRDASRHFEKNAMNFRVLLLQQAHEFVVLLDGFERLDEDRLSAGTGTVNDSVTRRFCSTFTGITKRSPRIVTSSSCTAPPSARCRK